MKQLILYCVKCKKATEHLECGFVGHNYRIECRKCHEVIKVNKEILNALKEINKC